MSIPEPPLAAVVFTVSFTVCGCCNCNGGGNGSGACCGGWWWWCGPNGMVAISESYTLTLFFLSLSSFSLKKNTFFLSLKSLSRISLCFEGIVFWVQRKIKEWEKKSVVSEFTFSHARLLESDIHGLMMTVRFLWWWWGCGIWCGGV